MKNTHAHTHVESVKKPVKVITKDPMFVPTGSAVLLHTCLAHNRSIHKNISARLISFSIAEKRRVQQSRCCSIIGSRSHLLCHKQDQSTCSAQLFTLRSSAPGKLLQCPKEAVAYIFNQSTCSLVGGVLLCNRHQVFEGGSS